MHAQQPAGAPLDALTSLRRQLRAGLVTEALASVQRLQATGAVEAKTRDAADLATAEAECRLARGEVKEATAAADELAPYLDLPGLTGALANHAHAEVAAALGDTGLAAEHCAEAGRLLDEAGEEPPDLVPWRVGAALAAVRQGHAGVAEALAREHLSVARAAGSTYATALGLRA